MCPRNSGSYSPTMKTNNKDDRAKSDGDGAHPAAKSITGESAASGQESRMLKLTLLDNCYSFLEEALRRALEAEENPKEWKFAIFNICQAIELFLKEQLKQEHPALVHRSVDKADGRTVTLEQAMGRLTLWCRVRLSKSDIESIKRVAKWRNEIVHSEFTVDPVQLKAAFSRLVGFLSEFHERIMDEHLKDVVGDSLWDKTVAIQKYGEELFERAKRRFADESVDPENIYVCPKCGYAAFVALQDDHYCRCSVCGNNEEGVFCSSCEHVVPQSLCTSSPTGLDEDHCYDVNICEQCVARAENEYINMMTDLALGK